MIEASVLWQLIALRQKAAGDIEDQYNLHVTVPKGQSMRVYMNHPGSKTQTVTKALIVPRNAFPRQLFD
jgi:hypothetical protein